MVHPETWIRASTAAVSLVGILFLASGCGGATPSPVPHSSPFVPPGAHGYEVVPVQHWTIAAGQDQADLISQRWGRSITLGELINRVFPDAAKELPAAIASCPLEIRWPTPSVDWQQTLSGGFIDSVSGTTIARGAPETAPRPTIDGTYGFHYFIGRRSLESPPELASPESPGIPFYFLSIYVPE